MVGIIVVEQATGRLPKNSKGATGERICHVRAQRKYCDVGEFVRDGQPGLGYLNSQDGDCVPLAFIHYVINILIVK